VTRGLVFIAAENFSAASTTGTVAGTDSTMNIEPRKKQLSRRVGIMCGNKLRQAGHEE
jgi:hypothetical protein